LGGRWLGLTGAASLDASRSFKYFGKGQGVGAYTFVYERNLLPLKSLDRRKCADSDHHSQERRSGLW
jgi:hypothetical protein